MGKPVRFRLLSPVFAAGAAGLVLLLLTPGGTGCLSASALGATASAARPSSAGTNVALGAKYTLSPPPSYAHCTDPEDAVQLTDGKTTTEYFWTQKGTVGWSGAPYAVITVDLGRVEPIAGASFTTAAGVAGVTWPASVLLLTSDDGRKYRNVGDLVALDRTAHGPLPQGYAIRRLKTSGLKTRGRYVRFLVLPLAGGSYMFVDEIEVFRGPEDLLKADPGGRPAGDVEELFQQGRIGRAIRHRFAADLDGLRKAIAAAGLTDASARNRLLGQYEAVRKELEGAAIGPSTGWQAASATAAGDSFRAVLPMSAAHARLFQVQADLWRSRRLPPLSAAIRPLWDPLDPFLIPDTSLVAAEVHTMRGEYRAAAIDLYNAADRPMTLRARLDSLPGSPAPKYVTVHEVQWTDTSQGIPVAAALPEAARADDAWTITVLPGLVRQVWLTFHVTDLEPGQYDGKVVLSPADKQPVPPDTLAGKQPVPPDTLAIPLRLKVWPLEFPRQTTLLLGGWSYTDGPGAYGITDKNRPAFLKHLQERFVNAPWATGAVMPAGEFGPGEPPSVTLDTRRLDDWLAQWPNARQYMVFLAVGSSFAGQPAGTAEFNRRVGLWISAWVRHLEGKGIAADRLNLLLHDEPGEGTDVGPIVAWARALRAAEPKLRIWEDPTYPDPRKAPKELFDACDVLCPNRPMWLQGGKPFAEFYLARQREGRTLQFYSCSGPARLLDPYTYYRLQAWHCFAVGGTGTFFWAFGDNSRASSWNEYLAVAGPFTPLFIDAGTVVPGKQMEAIRESIEDYECLAMLRRTVERARAAGRLDPAVARAEALLTTGVQEVLAAPGADRLLWHEPKDRALADQVRIRVLAALVELR